MSVATRLWKNVKQNKYLLLLLLPGFIYFIVFQYIPIYGLLIAFKSFSFGKGILGSPWVGFKWINQFFDSIYFWRTIKNTLLIGTYGLLWGFPIPILFALLLNNLRSGIYKKAVQTASYLPHFISTVVVVGMVVTFLSPNGGIVNTVIGLFGHETINFLNDTSWFRTIYIASDIWQNFGWDSIIYIAALATIDPQLYESATIDGAGKIRQLFVISLPSIMPTILVLLILQIGNIMGVGYEKIILLYNPATYSVSDVISTYVYRKGVVGSEFSFGAAVGLFNSVINFILLTSVNRISKKVTDISLW